MNFIVWYGSLVVFFTLLFIVAVYLVQVARELIARTKQVLDKNRKRYFT